MKKLLLAAISALGLIVAACSESQPEYVEKGSTSQERLNGERVFIVPYGSPTIEDSIGVDSTVIEDGKFEFRSRKGTYLARVTVDRRVRPGTSDGNIYTILYTQYFCNPPEIRYICKNSTITPNGQESNSQESDSFYQSAIRLRI